MSTHDPLLTLDEAGELLGTGPDLPRRLVAEGRLDGVRTPGGIGVRESALIAYVTAEERRASRSAGSVTTVDEAA